MPKILHFAKTVWIIFIALPLSTSAMLRDPTSYAILSADNQSMLVMCSTIDTNLDSGRVFTLPSGRQIDLRETFKTNGVYRLGNYEYVQPLDWYADEDELFASEDFSILVRLNGYAIETQNRTNLSWCLKFYEDGKEVKQYQVKDLVAMPHVLFLPQTSVNWHTVWHETAALTSGHGLYDITGSYHSLFQFVLVTEPQFIGPIKLSDGNVFVFNPFTGDIIQQWRHHPAIKFSIIVVLFFTFCILAIFLGVRILRKLFRKFRAKKV
jgi:hypothetical protein